MMIPHLLMQLSFCGNTITAANFVDPLSRLSPHPYSVDLLSSFHSKSTLISSSTDKEVLENICMAGMVNPGQVFQVPSKLFHSPLAQPQRHAVQGDGQWLLKNYGNSHRCRKPRRHWDWGMPKPYVDEPITKGWRHSWVMTANRRTCLIPGTCGSDDCYTVLAWWL